MFWSFLVAQGICYLSQSWQNSVNLLDDPVKFMREWQIADTLRN